MLNFGGVEGVFEPPFMETNSCTKWHGVHVPSLEIWKNRIAGSRLLGSDMNYVISDPSLNQLYPGSPVDQTKSLVFKTHRIHVWYIYCT